MLETAPIELPAGFSQAFGLFHRPEVKAEIPSFLPFDPDGRISVNNPSRQSSWIAVMITNECPVACAHCVAHSGGLLRGHMDGDLMERAIRDFAATPGAEGINFTGGEPFVARDLLLRGCKLARELGLKATIITSGNWGNYPSNIEKSWDPIAPYVDTLFVTLDVYHQIRVTIDSVRECLKAAKRDGVQAVILNPLNRQELEAGNRPTKVALDLADEFGLPIHAWPVLAQGRAVDIPDEIPIVDANQPCGLISKPVVMPDGEFHACACGAGSIHPVNPLKRGFMKDRPLGDMIRGLSASTYVQAIRALGPVRCLELIGETPGEWAGQCGACSQLGDLENVAERVREAVLARPEVVAHITAHRRAAGDTDPEEHLPPERRTQHRNGAGKRVRPLSRAWFKSILRAVAS